MYGHLRKYREYVWKYNETYRTRMETYGDIWHIHVNIRKIENTYGNIRRYLEYSCEYRGI